MDSNKKLSGFRCVVTDASQKEADRYLYRGVSDTLHLKNGGRLVPKKDGPFVFTVSLSSNKPLRLDGSWTVGASEKNADFFHQKNSDEFKTSGISTTPHFSRALVYARGKNGNNSGVVYMIDRELLASAGVTERVVADTVTKPNIPEDAEVILVTADGGTLPAHVVIDFSLLPAKRLPANNLYHFLQVFLRAIPVSRKAAKAQRKDGIERVASGL
jgi:hypothetical protein